VITAVLASMALPVVLPPVEVEGRVLVDGGLVNNTAFDVAQKRGLDRVIAVDLTNVAAYGSAIDTPLPSQPMERILAGFFRRPMQRLMGAVVDVVLAHNLEEHLQHGAPDVLLRPNLGTIGIFDFHCQEDAIKAGRAAVVEAEATLRALRGE
jgi:NTE family protein